MQKRWIHNFTEFKEKNKDFLENLKKEAKENNFIVNINGEAL